jgi:hypothetical protein
LRTLRLSRCGSGPLKGDLVKVECACGHSELLTTHMLATAGVKPYQSIVDLQIKL